VATSRGIQVALAKSTTVNATSDWLPGFFRAADGTYVPFDPNSILVSGSPLPDPDAGIAPGNDAGSGADGGGSDAGSDAGSDGGTDAGIDAGTDGGGGPIAAGAIDAGFVRLPYAVAVPDGGTIPFPQDAGFVAADFDGHGNVLFTRPNPSQRVGS